MSTDLALTFTTVSRETIRRNTIRESRTFKTLLLRRLAVHHRHPLAPIRRHFVFKVVRARREFLDCKSRLYNLVPHLLVARPRPGVTIVSALRGGGLAHAVELVIRVHLFVRVVAHYRQTRAAEGGCLCL